MDGGEVLSSGYRMLDAEKGQGRAAPSTLGAVVMAMGGRGVRYETVKRGLGIEAGPCRQLAKQLVVAISHESATQCNRVPLQESRAIRPQGRRRRLSFRQGLSNLKLLALRFSGTQVSLCIVAVDRGAIARS